MQILLILLFLSSNAVATENHLHDVLNEFNRTSYILTYVEAWPERSYNKEFDDGYDKFIQDSINYYKAVLQFRNLDKSVIDTLITFLNVSSSCNWVRTHDYYSSLRTSFDKLVKRKDIAALILIENFLKPSPDNIIYIPNDFPKLRLNNLPLYLLDKAFISSFWENNREKELVEIRTKFVKFSGRHKYIEYSP